MTRQAWKWSVFVLIASLGIALVIVAANHMLARNRLEKRIATLRDAGEPLSLADLERPPIPPEDNAATFLRRAKSDIDAIEKEAGAAYQAATEAEQEGYYAGSPPIAMLQAIRNGFTSYPKAIDLLRQASQCRDYDSQLDFRTDTHSFMADFTKHFLDNRVAIRVLNHYVLLKLSEREYDEAIDACFIMFRLANHFDRDPLIVGQLVSVAVRTTTISATNKVLRAGEFSDSVHEALENELANINLLIQLQRAIRSERAFGLQNLRESSTRLGFVRRLLRFRTEEDEYLDLIETATQNAAHPRVELEDSATKRLRFRNASPLVQELAPTLDADYYAVNRLQAQISALRILNVLLRNRITENDGVQKLIELGLPKETMVDPFNDQPLNIKKLPEGWVIYSVGIDCKDDGGLGDLGITDVGLGPPSLSKAHESKRNDTEN